MTVRSQVRHTTAAPPRTIIRSDRRRTPVVWFVISALAIAGLTVAITLMTTPDAATRVPVTDLSTAVREGSGFAAGSTAGSVTDLSTAVREGSGFAADPVTDLSTAVREGSGFAADR